MLFKPKYSLFFLLSLYISFSANAQETVPAFTIEGKFHYGYVWKHSSKIDGDITAQNPFGFELDYIRRCSGVKPWQRSYKNLYSGYSLYYYHFDHKKPIGDLAAFLTYLSKPIFRTKRIEMLYRIAFGIGYVEKRFHESKNSNNFLISARINHALNGQITLRAKISEKVVISTGVGLLHLSNGAFKMPNLGINVPSAFLGIGINSGKSCNVIKDSLPEFRKKIDWNIAVSAGLKELPSQRGNKYFAGSVSVYPNFRVTRKSGLNAGLDYFYDKSSDQFFHDNPDKIVSELPEHYMRVGVAAGHELYFGKFAMLTQIGYYLYDPVKAYEKIYQRYGLKFYLHDKFYISYALRAHFGRAEIVEYSMGLAL
ncbi:MAG: acyloxyacyl hydrolase [Cytophagaceae bacterium]